MTETTDRFFHEISSRIGYHKVTELHLFPPIRQGSQESGIAVIAATPEVVPPEGSRERHVVYTARYRQTLKGPDRGKWEFDLKAEADAPLITVDEVVRGVVRRSGDEVHPDRISGDQFRETVPAPPEPEPVAESIPASAEAELAEESVSVEADAEPVEESPYTSIDSEPVRESVPVPEDPESETALSEPTDTPPPDSDRE